MGLSVLRSLVALVSVLPACANAFVNPSFETGTVAGWTPIGLVSAQIASVGVTPTQGTYMGYIDNTGNGTVSAAVISSFLGVPGPAMLGLGQGAPTVGSALKQSITVAAGQTMSFDWNYITDELNELATYNDFAFISINSTPTLLASRNASIWNTIAPPPGFDGQTGWASFSHTFTSAGTYTIGFTSLNVNDAGHNSVLLIDAFALSPIPEPTSLFCAAGVMLAARRRRL